MSVPGSRRHRSRQVERNEREAGKLTARRASTTASCRPARGFVRIAAPLMYAVAMCGASYGVLPADEATGIFLGSISHTRRSGSRSGCELFAPYGHSHEHMRDHRRPTATGWERVYHHSDA